MKLRRHKWLNPTLLLPLGAVAFRFDGSHVAWLWRDQPGAAVLLDAGAVACVGSMLIPPRGAARS